MSKDIIYRQDAIDAVEFGITYAKAFNVNTGESNELFKEGNDALKKAVERLKELPSAQPERLIDDDFETIRIHLSAYKEKLCNQQRWKEAEEYQRIIDRFMEFASAQPERKRGKWVHIQDNWYRCSECGAEREQRIFMEYYCPNCGADMRGEQDG